MMDGECREGGTGITLRLEQYSSEPSTVFSMGELKRRPRVEVNAPGKDDRRCETGKHNAESKVDLGRTLVFGEAATSLVSRIRPASEVLLGGRRQRGLLLGSVVRHAPPIVRESRL